MPRIDWTIWLSPKISSTAVRLGCLRSLSCCKLIGKSDIRLWYSRVWFGKFLIESNVIVNTAIAYGRQGRRRHAVGRQNNSGIRAGKTVDSDNVEKRAERKPTARRSAAFDLRLHSKLGNLFSCKLWLINSSAQAVSITEAMSRSQNFEFQRGKGCPDNQIGDHNLWIQLQLISLQSSLIAYRLLASRRLPACRAEKHKLRLSIFQWQPYQALNWRPSERLACSKRLIMLNRLTDQFDPKLSRSWSLRIFINYRAWNLVPFPCIRVRAPRSESSDLPEPVIESAGSLFDLQSNNGVFLTVPL